MQHDPLRRRPHRRRELPRLLPLGCASGSQLEQRQQAAAFADGGRLHGGLQQLKSTTCSSWPAGRGGATATALATRMKSGSARSASEANRSALSRIATASSMNPRAAFSAAEACSSAPPSFATAASATSREVALSSRSAAEAYRSGRTSRSPPAARSYPPAPAVWTGRAAHRLRSACGGAERGRPRAGASPVRPLSGALSGPKTLAHCLTRAPPSSRSGRTRSHSPGSHGLLLGAAVGSARFRVVLMHPLAIPQPPTDGPRAPAR